MLPVGVAILEKTNRPYLAFFFPFLSLSCCWRSFNIFKKRNMIFISDRQGCNKKSSKKETGKLNLPTRWIENKQREKLELKSEQEKACSCDSNYLVKRDIQRN